MRAFVVFLGGRGVGTADRRRCVMLCAADVVSVGVTVVLFSCLFVFLAVCLFPCPADSEDEDDGGRQQQQGAGRAGQGKAGGSGPEDLQVGHKWAECVRSGAY